MHRPVRGTVYTLGSHLTRIFHHAPHYTCSLYKHMLELESELLTWSNCVLISANSLCENWAISSCLSSQPLICNLPVLRGSSRVILRPRSHLFWFCTASAVTAHAHIPTRPGHAQNASWVHLCVHVALIHSYVYAILTCFCIAMMHKQQGVA